MWYKLSKEALTQLSKIAKKLNISLKDLLFWNNNILIVKNNPNEKNIINTITDEKIIIDSKIKKWVLKITVKIPDNYKADIPLHFCFLLDKEWARQFIEYTCDIWENSTVNVFNYCFWLWYNIVHWDKKEYHIKKNSSLKIYDFNYNMNKSHIKTYSNFDVYVYDNAIFEGYYIATIWQLWHWIINWNIYCKWEKSKVKFISKSKVLNNDISNINILCSLEWKESSWLITSKSVTYKWWTNKITWKIMWIWDNTVWHISCDEISIWNCVIWTSPELLIKNSSSKLTHESSIWALDKKLIENLMVKWFTEEEAIEFLVNWLLDIS